MGTLRLNGRQIAILVAQGAALWLFAAITLRLLAPYGIYEGWGRVLLYLLVVPATYPFVPFTVKLAGIALDQIAVGIAVVTAAATLLDGIALAWVPSLYGSEIEHIAGAGAAILWGAGVGLVLGFALNGKSEA